jgi:hypothetical protein
MPPGGRLTLVLPLAGGRGHQLAPPTHPAWRWGLLDVIAPSHVGKHTNGEGDGGVGEALGLAITWLSDEFSVVEQIEASEMAVWHQVVVVSYDTNM